MLAICFTLASCTNGGSTSSTSDTTAQTITPTTQTPVSTDGGTAVQAPSSDDIETILIGKHITLHYNGASADIEYTVKQGVGSRQTVTLTVKMKDDYIFDGWSEGDAIVNGKSVLSSETTYEINAADSQTIYLNTSMQLVYHPNGGKTTVSDTDKFSAVFYQNPNTRSEKDYFSRDGYTLTGYNTKADGTGESVSLGSKVTGGKGIIDLYCIWEQNTPDSEFKTESRSDGLYITGYTGSGDSLVIPKKLGGKKVVGIAENAFKNADFTRAVISQNVKTIEKNAFNGCDKLTSLVLFDTVTRMDDSAFASCDALTSVRVNTTTELIDAWYSCGAAKIDRLMWAKDKKKLIIIGGSGSLYGFDCDMLYSKLDGEYEIINFGENANISSLVYFDIAEDFVNYGDIILWCPEPGTYTLGADSCGNRFWDFRKSDYDFTKYIDFTYYKDFFSSFARYCQSLTRTFFKPYSALSSSMNKYGDDTSSRVWNEVVFDYSFDYDIACKDILGALTTKIHDKGAKIFFSFAAMQESGIASTDEKDILDYEKLVTSVPYVTAISTYEECILDDECFWDSAWHLTLDGAVKRTEQVAYDIKKALSNS